MRQLAFLFALTLLTSCATGPAKSRVTPAPPTSLPMAIAQKEGPAQVPVSISADGKLLLTTDDQFAGLYLTDTSTSQTTTLNRCYNAGYYASISADNQYVSFKAFRPAEEKRLEQAAMLYTIKNGETHNLSGWIPVAGTPAVSSKGKVAFAAGDQLVVLSPDLKTEKIYHIDHASNLIDFAPSEEEIAYTNDDEQISILTLKSGKNRIITDGKNSYWGPKFSPNGGWVAYRTINGKVGATELLTGRVKPIGAGESQSWIGAAKLVYVDGGTVKLISPDIDEKPHTAGDIGPRWWAVNGRSMASQQKDRLKWASVQNEKLVSVNSSSWVKPDDVVPPKHAAWPTELKDDGFKTERKLVDRGESMELTGVPYVNQVYDAPDEFDGHWACNVTSALMCLGYHNALEPNPISVSRISTHNSNFGAYMSRPYTRGDKTFDVQSPEPGGKPAAGGYGYIVREDWKNTKDYMADYFKIHGIDSSVDWSPSIAEARKQIDRKDPFVVLNSLTLAGHYITCIGYVKDRNTLVYNDPYGNKNSREYPSMDGRRAFYDMPGYNNGYQNLREVHCFIYTDKDKAPEKAAAGN
ncbi:hypothetical protein BH09SUM1_BH09SUM1_31330 [soil metagenome]